MWVLHVSSLLDGTVSCLLEGSESRHVLIPCFDLKLIILNIYLLTRKYTLMQVENVGVTNLPPLKKSGPEI